MVRNTEQPLERHKAGSSKRLRDGGGGCAQDELRKKPSSCSQEGRAQCLQVPVLCLEGSSVHERLWEGGRLHYLKHQNHFFTGDLVLTLLHL